MRPKTSPHPTVPHPAEPCRNPPYRTTARSNSLPLLRHFQWQNWTCHLWGCVWHSGLTTAIISTPTTSMGIVDSCQAVLRQHPNNHFEHGVHGRQIHNQVQATAWIRRYGKSRIGHECHYCTHHLEAIFFGPSSPWNPVPNTAEQMNKCHRHTELHLNAMHEIKHTVSMPTSKDSNRLEKAIT